VEHYSGEILNLSLNLCFLGTGMFIRAFPRGRCRLRYGHGLAAR
jgi:hypothetical protein